MNDYWVLIRPRILGAVLFTIAVAAMVTGRDVRWWPLLAHALVGTGLVIVGAIALNQRLEHGTDALMLRTARRPLPTGRLSNAQVTLFGAVASIAGILYLYWLVTAATVVLAVVSWVIYVWVYTPLKLFTTWQTPIGAVTGAMPTLLGAAAVNRPTALIALVMFGIVFFWQFPHAMAIAWIYRHEFAAADVKVATVVDPSGRTAAWMAVTGAVALLAVSLVPSGCHVLGWGYALAAAVLGLGYLAASIDFLLRTNDATARRLLRVSLVYLIAIFVALLVAALA